MNRLFLSLSFLMGVVVLSSNYLVQFPIKYYKFEEILSTFQILIKEGKIRYLGLSNENLSGLKKYIELSKKNNFPEIVSMQNRYNLIYRNYNPELINFCKIN